MSVDDLCSKTFLWGGYGASTVQSLELGMRLGDRVLELGLQPLGLWAEFKYCESLSCSQSVPNFQVSTGSMSKSDIISLPLGGPASAVTMIFLGIQLKPKGKVDVSLFKKADFTGPNS